MIKAHVDGPKIKEIEFAGPRTIVLAEFCLCFGFMIEKISEKSGVPKEHTFKIITNLIKETWEHKDNVETQEINIDVKDSKTEISEKIKNDIWKDLKEFIKTM